MFPTVAFFLVSAFILCFAAFGVAVVIAGAIVAVIKLLGWLFTKKG